MKIGVSSYSFGRVRGIEKFDQIIDMTKELGFDFIEFSGFPTPEGTDPADYARFLGQKCRDAELEVRNYAVGANFIGTDINAEVEKLKKQVEYASLLGSKRMRHDCGWSQAVPFENVLPQIAEGCRKTTEFAKQYGIETCTENHGQFCQESTRIEKIIAAVGDPNFGSLIDVGNFLCADDDPAVAVGRLAPYAKHVHFKDFHVKSGQGPNPGEGFFRSRGGNYLRGAIIGHGNVPVQQALIALKSAGYDGGVSIEFEGMEDGLQGIKIGRDNLRRMLATI